MSAELYPDHPNYISPEEHEANLALIASILRGDNHSSGEADDKSEDPITRKLIDKFVQGRQPRPVEEVSEEPIAVIELSGSRSNNIVLESLVKRFAQNKQMREEEPAPAKPAERASTIKRSMGRQ